MKTISRILSLSLILIMAFTVIVGAEDSKEEGQRIILQKSENLILDMQNAVSGLPTAESNASNVGRETFSITRLYDPNTNLTAGRCYAPSNFDLNWVVSIYGIQGNTLGPSCPYQLSVTATDSVRDIVMGYTSKSHFMWTNEGEVARSNVPLFSVLAPVMSASEYADQFILDMYSMCDEIYLIGESGLDQNGFDKLQARAQLNYDVLDNDLARSNGIYVRGAESSYAERTYAFSYNGINYCAQVVTVSDLTSVDMVASSYTEMVIPFLYYFCAPEEYFQQELMSFYQFIFNTRTTDQFEQLREEVKIATLNTLNGGQPFTISDQYVIDTLGYEDGYYFMASFLDELFNPDIYIAPKATLIKMLACFDHVYEMSDGTFYASVSESDVPAGASALPKNVNY